MDNEYKGISFPFRIGGRGGVVLSGQSNSIQQHIKDCLMVLLTSKEGERVMRPYNGLEELDIFFNDLNETTKNMAIFKITEKVQEYEPRVVIEDIQIREEIQVDDSIVHVIDLTYSEADTETTSSVSVRM